MNYNISRGLVDRIAASHPGGPGSNPSRGKLAFLPFFLLNPNFKGKFQGLGELGRMKDLFHVKVGAMKGCFI